MATPDNRRKGSWVQSNWFQAPLILGSLGLLAVLNWTVNDDPDWVVAIIAGAGLGLVLGLILRARRRRSDRP